MIPNHNNPQSRRLILDRRTNPTSFISILRLQGQRQGFRDTRRAVDPVAGKPSRTGYKVVQRLGKRAAAWVTRILATAGSRWCGYDGRAHQLRVHLAWLGHPIVGDKIYGPEETWYLRFIAEGVAPALLERLLLPRHALHAGQLTLRHPGTRQPSASRRRCPDVQRLIAARGGTT